MKNLLQCEKRHSSLSEGSMDTEQGIEYPSFGKKSSRCCEIDYLNLFFPFLNF